MALPIATAPSYELTVPSTKQKVKFRPFLVKEEKALLLAQQSDNDQTMIDTLKNVIAACTYNKLDMNKLALFDVEYIFLQLRAKSVGEISELVYSCLQCGDPKAKVTIPVDLTQVEVTFDPEHKSDIDLYENVGVRMRYPDIAFANKNANEDGVEAIFNMIIDCIESIYDDENIYVAEEQSREELEEFLNNLTQDQFNKIKTFFDTMPKLEKTIEFDCPVCAYHHVQKIEGINDFF